MVLICAIVRAACRKDGHNEQSTRVHQVIYSYGNSDVLQIPVCAASSIHAQDC